MQDNEEITIELSFPEQREQMGGVNKFHLYQLSGKDSNGIIQNNRRYSDFTLLRDILISRWPGFYIPSLPSKRTIGANQVTFLESRRRGLKYFLITISKNKTLWNSLEVQIFLRNTNGTSDKEISILSKQGKDKLLTRYQGLFPNYETDNQSSKTKLLQFGVYLKEVKLILQKLQKQTEIMTESFKKGIEKKYIFLQFLLPDYEKNCLLANDQKGKPENLLFLCSNTNGINECLQRFKKSNEYMSIVYVYQQIKRQRKQIEGFLQILKAKEQYESLRLKASAKVKDLELSGSKIQSGKQSILSKIKKKSKEQQLQTNKAELTQAQAQQTIYVKLCQIINNLLIKEQIERFKQIRKNAYYELLRNFMKAEKELSQLQRDIWVQVGRHDLINIQQENLLIKKQIKEEYKPIMDVIDEDQTNQIEEQEPETKKKDQKSREQQIVHDDDL